MSHRQPSTSRTSAAFRGVLLAFVVVALLAVFLGLIGGVGLLRLRTGQTIVRSSPDRSPPEPPVASTTEQSGEPVTDRAVQMKPEPGVVEVRAGPDPSAAEPPHERTVPWGPMAKPQVAAVALPAQGASASLLRVDDTTQGGWVGRYGKAGFYVAMAGATPHLPPDVQATMDRSQFYNWSPVTTDLRALSIPEDPPHRSAGQWFYWDHFSLDLDLGGANKSCQVGLYLLDWDSDSRAQGLEVMDAASGHVLLSRTDEHFKNGRYVILRLSGHVVLRFTRIGGANCTLSGIFLDDLPPAVP
jgi:hypothetical protein